MSTVRARVANRQLLETIPTFRRFFIKAIRRQPTVSVPLQNNPSSLQWTTKVKGIKKKRKKKKGFIITFKGKKLKIDHFQCSKGSFFPTVSHVSDFLNYLHSRAALGLLGAVQAGRGHGCPRTGGCALPGAFACLQMRAVLQHDLRLFAAALCSCT